MSDHHHYHHGATSIAAGGGGGGGGIASASISSHHDGDDDHNTYEARRAQQMNLPDRIHWKAEYAYRQSSPYRALHHQKGIVGTFRVQLLEGRNLRRSYWSPLALGPVKHLGLSRAHGPVSSFCEFSLVATHHPPLSSSPSRRKRTRRRRRTLRKENTPKLKDGENDGRNGDNDDFDDDYDEEDDDDYGHDVSFDVDPSFQEREQKCPPVRARSPVILSNDHPVWNNCEYDMELTKSDLQRAAGGIGGGAGGGGGDGSSVVLGVAVYEESTAAEGLLSPMTAALLSPSPQDRLLGRGELDLTDLLLGRIHEYDEEEYEDNDDDEDDENENAPMETLAAAAKGAGQSQHVGVLDVWIPLRLPNQQQQQQYQGEYNYQDEDEDQEEVEKLKTSKGADPSSASASSSSSGRVRVLVSYRPHGMDPRPHDLVGLEAFARARPDHAQTCAPVLSPVLQPFKVLQQRGSYLLLEYAIPHQQHYHPAAQTKGTIRVHRNATFVIERTNAADGAVALALAPADWIMSTPWGRSTTRAAAPVVEAAADLVMPALLSAQLLYVALRTTGFAALSGVQAAAWAVLQQSRQSHQDRQQRYDRHSSSAAEESSASGGGPSPPTHVPVGRHHERV